MEANIKNTKLELCFASLGWYVPLDRRTFAAPPLVKEGWGDDDKTEEGKAQIEADDEEVNFDTGEWKEIVAGWNK